MTRAEKENIIAMPTVGYWSMMGGVEVKEILHGIEDYAIVVAGSWFGHSTVHKLRIRYKDDDFYVLLDGRKLKFSECLRN